MDRNWIGNKKGSQSEVKFLSEFGTVAFLFTS